MLPVGAKVRWVTRDGTAGRDHIRKGLEHLGREFSLHLKGQRNKSYIIQRAFQVGREKEEAEDQRTKD